MTKRRLETLGGLGSIGVGLFCLGVALYDGRAGHSIWVVWVGMSLVLVGNGIAMVKHVRPLTPIQKGRPSRP